MNDKFEDLPTDRGTKILFRSPSKWGDLDITYEKWQWDGIEAESVIFLTEDVEAMDDEALEKMVRESDIVEKDSQITIKRLEKFTFVNFNFYT